MRQRNGIAFIINVLSFGAVVALDKNYTNAWFYKVIVKLNWLNTRMQHKGLAYHGLICSFSYQKAI